MGKSFHSPRRWGLKVPILAGVQGRRGFHSPRRWGLKGYDLNAERVTLAFHSPRRWGLKVKRRREVHVHGNVSLPT